MIPSIMAVHIEKIKYTGLLVGTKSEDWIQEIYRTQQLCL